MGPTFLGDRTPAEFLEKYWQKRPLLIRQALPNFASPLDPNELAGLACEENVHSRLILEQGGKRPWEMREGPFDTETFLDLPATHWSLLVQEVDRLVPAVHDLLEHVSFLPRWRVDDIMVSYAPEKGGVGAHIDNYDVFLLQGYGHRRWEISYDKIPPGKENLVSDIDVRMLADFEADESWVLEPGDVLYLPPRVPHYGVALDDCMTYSIGFHAASHREMLLGFLEHLAETVAAEERYSDPDLAPREAPGRIAPEDLSRVHQTLNRLLNNPSAIDQWFGKFVTRSQRGGSSLPPSQPLTPEQLVQRVKSQHPLRRSEASRFSYIDQPSGKVLLFVNGELYPVDDSRLAELPALLSNHSTLPHKALGPLLDLPDGAELITQLYNKGHLYFPDAP